MKDFISARRLGSCPCEEDEEGELRYTFVGKWQHFFETTKTFSVIRWVFDREEWCVAFLEILNPMTLEWVRGTSEEVSSVETDLVEGEAQYLEDLDEWGLSDSDDLPDWACTQAELDERLEVAIRERLAESRRRNAIRLQLPRGRHVRTVTIRFARFDD
ncbi:hypothetical protein ASG43_17465 [Aureimonas sp. Leaf454]|uniref:hypothetical protein n=1 Tax=Aureimonas sp. Leaf454 TaxID=1736381 RepID=UPI0006FA3E50|nr:hypothetical protein [Aureimonas sp. Leaf454]KQT42064.1 hypothetical protein ASG43_17465 [Aureimonas sp. Leaf454]